MSLKSCIVSLKYLYVLDIFQSWWYYDLVCRLVTHSSCLRWHRYLPANQCWELEFDRSHENSRHPSPTVKVMAKKEVEVILNSRFLFLILHQDIPLIFIETCIIHVAPYSLQSIKLNKTKIVKDWKNQCIYTRGWG